MEHGEVVLGAFLPPDEDAPKAVEPGVSTFDHPTPGTPSRFLSERGDLLAAGAQMKRKAELLSKEPHLVVVISLVQAETLRPLTGRFGSCHHDAHEGLAYELVIIAVGAGDADAQRYAGRIGKERALRPFFPLSVGFGPVFWPPKGALVIAPSSARKSQAMPCSAS